MQDKDHDILIRVDTKLDGLGTQFSNHLKHHFLFALAALTTAVTAIIALIVTLV